MTMRQQWYGAREQFGRLHKTSAATVFYKQEFQEFSGDSVITLFILCRVRLSDASKEIFLRLSFLKAISVSKTYYKRKLNLQSSDALNKYKKSQERGHLDHINNTLPGGLP